MENKILGYLGLASKAGQIISGFDIILSNINDLFCIIIAENTSEKTKTRLLTKINNVLDNVNTKQIYIYEIGNININSKAIGKRNKALIGVLDKGFAEAIKKAVHEEVENGKV